MSSVDELKEQAAVRFAAGLKRMPWADQWSQLSRLEVGLNRNDRHESWFAHLDSYFEMRNCIIHRRGKVSTLLLQKSDYYRERNKVVVDIWPQHLDFYRRQFLECGLYIEQKIGAKNVSTSSAENQSRSISSMAPQ